MALMTWSETYDVNIDEVNDQHQEIFRLVNALHDSLSEDRAVIADKLNALVVYVVEHFATEEKLMQENEFPNYAEHKAAHDDLVSKVADIQGKFNAGEVEITEEITAFVRDWLYQHIPNTDKKYSPYLNEKGVK